MGKLIFILNLSLNLFLPIMGLGEATGPDYTSSFSRTIIYDVRGMNRNESSLIIEKKNNRVQVWYRNHLGNRYGTMPVEEYDRCFDDILKIKQFALRKKHRGKLLRRNAAKGSITLAWKNSTGEKEIKTISYYAPENTLDDFRLAFNQLWALSRYALLSVHSLENAELALREDALYFMAGSGWMTKSEIRTVIDHHQSRGYTKRVARSVWSTLNQAFSSQSVFNDRSYLRYCVKKSILALGESARPFLQSRTTSSSKFQQQLANEIISELNVLNE